MLEQTLTELADLFREHGETAMAEALVRMAADDSDQLPRRVLDLFTHGMGGIYDAALYRDGHLDQAATSRRKELAERLYEEARQRLK